jgi:hypothetical protein
MYWLLLLMKRWWAQFMFSCFERRGRFISEPGRFIIPSPQAPASSPPFFV